jgi:hypothetical protein
VDLERRRRAATSAMVSSVFMAILSMFKRSRLSAMIIYPGADPDAVELTWELSTIHIVSC